MTKENSTFDAIIIGAGISGLNLARHLVSKKQNVLVIEKSKSVGGRIATRRDGEAAFDHGAQFYRVKDSEPSTFDQNLSEAGIVHTWFKHEDKSYQAASKGMTGIPKYLAMNLRIIFSERVLSFRHEFTSTVRVQCESGQDFLGKNVFLSSPLPQSLAILNASQISYPQNLNNIQYAQALVGLFEIETQDKNILEFQYEQNINEDFFSISNQLSKNVSRVPAFTVTMSPDWSQRHFENEEHSTLKLVQQAFIEYFCSKSDKLDIRKSQLKKWRFSHPLTIHSSPYERLTPSKNIYLFGDAFGGDSVMGAIRSAEQLSNNLFPVT